MKIFQEIKDIDKTSWSEFVKVHSNGNIFQTPEFFDIYSLTKNYNPSVLAVYIGSRLVGILLSVEQREYQGYLGNLTSRSLIIGGPLINDTDERELVFKEIVKAYVTTSQNRNIYSQIRNINNSSDYKKTLLELSFDYEDHLNFLLDLSKGKKSVWSSLHKKRRNTIRKAKKSNLQVIESRKREDYLESYDILSKHYKNINLPLADFSLFENSIKNLYNKNMVRCFNAIYEGKSIGTIWLLFYRDRAYNWYLGSLSEHLDKCPNDLLVWYSIEYAINNGFEIFDMGGAGKPDEIYGVRDFKKKFGGTEVCFGRYKCIYNNFTYSTIMKLLEFKKKLYENNS